MEEKGKITLHCSKITSFDQNISLDKWGCGWGSMGLASNVEEGSGITALQLLANCFKF